MVACSAGIPFSWRARAGGGGLSLRRELERVTDMFSNSSSSSVRAPSLAPLLPRTMVWGPGQWQGGGRARRRGTQDGHPTQADRTTQHAQRQDRDAMKKCHGVMVGWEGGGRPGRPPRPLPQHRASAGQEGAAPPPPIELLPPGWEHRFPGCPSEKHPLLFLVLQAWGAGAVPALRGGGEGGQRPRQPIISPGKLQITGCGGQGPAWHFLACSLAGL